MCHSSFFLRDINSNIICSSQHNFFSHVVVVVAAISVVNDTHKDRGQKDILYNVPLWESTLSPKKSKPTPTPMTAQRRRKSPSDHPSVCVPFFLTNVILLLDNIHHIWTKCDRPRQSNIYPVLPPSSASSSSSLKQKQQHPPTPETSAGSRVAEADENMHRLMNKKKKNWASTRGNWRRDAWRASFFKLTQNYRRTYTQSLSNCDLLGDPKKHNKQQLEPNVTWRGPSSSSCHGRYSSWAQLSFVKH